jgi:hypothetical protein
MQAEQVAELEPPSIAMFLNPNDAQLQSANTKSPRNRIRALAIKRHYSKILPMSAMQRAGQYDHADGRPKQTPKKKGLFDIAAMRTKAGR